MSGISKLVRAIMLPAILPMCLLGGCTEYMSRSDKIGFGAGDASAANKAVHIIDPWPRDGFNTGSRTIGQRAAAPIQRYRDGAQQSGASAAPVSGTSGNSNAAAGGGVTTSQ